METVELILVTWGLYLVPFLLLGGPVWFFGRKRVHWNGWDFALTLLPFAVWMLLMITHGAGKSLANLAEAMYLGCMAPLAPMVRVAFGEKANHRLLALGLLVAMCLVAIGVWAFVPALPE